LATLLAAAKRPALIAAEDVHWSDAAAALEALARLIGAPVYVAPYTGVLPVASTATCYAGYLPPSMKQIAERLAPHDVLFFVGGRSLRTTLYSEGRLPQRKLWLGYDPSVSPPDGEFDFACTADPRAALRALAREIQKRDKAPRGKSSPRPASELPPRQDMLHPTRAIHALLERFGTALWLDESGLSTSDVRQWMKLPAGDYLINGSGGIGWGLAAAVGAAIGCPERQIVAVIGDGSALYASEALWTAAHHATKILLVILSNRRYATLNEAAGRLTGGALDSFTIEPPVIDFSGLATLYDWAYARASSAPELKRFLASARRGITRNTLLELKLDPALKPVTASRHF
jgi:benzoylformate decarboxylase